MTIDHQGYPTEETLKKISEFNILTDDPIAFTEYLCENWINGYPPKYDKKHGTLQLSTGGWSGCESIISALKNSKKYPTYWMMFWYSSRVGGHYVFHNIRRIKK
jgi:hypothetical protein